MKTLDLSLIDSNQYKNSQVAGHSHDLFENNLSNFLHRAVEICDTLQKAIPVGYGLHHQ